MYLIKNKTIKLLSNSWQQSGINRGDLVILHSNIMRSLYYYYKKGIKLTPEDIFYSFLDAIGENGTILFPCFDINIKKNMEFDIKNSKSKMGILSEIARNYKDSFRTKHPLYSFAVIGNKKNLFYKCDEETGVGKGSPFNIVHQNDGKIAVLNLNEKSSMTFYHYVEKMHNVEYRHIIDFNVKYIDENNFVSHKEYSYYARKRDNGVVTLLEPVAKILWKKKLYKGNPYNIGNGLRTIKARDIYLETSKIILSGKAEGMLYKIDNSNLDE